MAPTEPTTAISVMPSPSKSAATPALARNAALGLNVVMGGRFGMNCRSTQAPPAGSEPAKARRRAQSDRRMTSGDHTPPDAASQYSSPLLSRRGLAPDLSAQSHGPASTPPTTSPPPSP